eukprot:comp35281_c0_seq1/m.47315 comp35281_c0_seq1/g.47315  ORF comp35281_c0_seq1/g.47315 comp35281_c0_seq1/m.47315 type:complete len:401 (-) comp35281_c0_seq1:76-1278(-)
MLQREQHALLYDTLVDVLQTDPLLDEFGLTLDEYDPTVDIRSVFFCQEHKLGVPAWAAQPLASVAQRTIFKHQAQILGDTVAPDSTVNSLLYATKVLLLIDADHYTAWNIRRRLTQKKHIDPQHELRFVSLVFSQHPKCGPAWVHRRWLLRLIYPEMKDGEEWTRILEKELETCRRVAELYKKNYFAWSHRQLVVGQYVYANSALFQKEIEGAVTWLETHVSDHSGAHHLQFLLLRMLQASPSHSHHTHHTLTHPTRFPTFRTLYAQQPTFNGREEQNMEPPWVGTCNVCGVFLQQTVLSDNLVCAYGGHETLWAHRRFVYATWLQLLADHLTTLEQSAQQHGLLQLWLQHDICVVKDAQADIHSYTHAEQVRLAGAYTKWMERRMGQEANKSTHSTLVL